MNQIQNICILKIGGNVLLDEKALSRICSSITSIPDCHFVVIHGGGPQLDEWAHKCGIKQKKQDGRRITDAATLELVTMVFAGSINKNLVAAFQKNQINAIGLSGADGQLIPSKRRTNSEIDFGFVGDVEEDKINIPLLIQLMNAGYVPVICPVTLGENSTLLNTNADTIAAGIAAAFSKQFHTRLLFCFDKPGLLLNAENDQTIIPKTSEDDFEYLYQQGHISNGMIPKLKNAFAAKSKGVNHVFVGNTDSIEFMTGKYFPGTEITG